MKLSPAKPKSEPRATARRAGREDPPAHAAGTDEELMRSYMRRGDRGAFEELVRRYEGELYNYLRRYLGDAVLAEDTFQATFLQVHLKCDSFDCKRKFRPWLYTIATNQAIDAARRNKRHRQASLDRREGWDNESSLSDLAASDEPGPFERLAALERGELARQAVATLPEPLKAAINLIYYQGLKYREAAEALNVPVGTVKSRMNAAVNKLGQVFQDWGVFDKDEE